MPEISVIGISILAGMALIGIARQHADATGAKIHRSDWRGQGDQECPGDDDTDRRMGRHYACDGAPESAIAFRGPALAYDGNGQPIHAVAQ